MRSVIEKWGNSASVRLPVALMEAAHLELDQAVDIRESKSRIIIEPVQRVEYDLKDLLNDIDADNLHKPEDFGAPLGKEI
jgi:antitoxin MazE